MATVVAGAVVGLLTVVVVVVPRRLSTTPISAIVISDAANPPTLTMPVSDQIRSDSFSVRA